MRKICLILLVQWIIIGASYFIFLTPRVVILQNERSISLQGIGRDFVINPSKVLITRWGIWNTVVIPIKIWNGDGDTTYVVEEKAPILFDQGYEDVNNYNDYKCLWDKSIINMKENSYEVVNIRVVKMVNNPHPKLEKGIAITQKGNSRGIMVVRSYIFEILMQ